MSEPLTKQETELEVSPYLSNAIDVDKMPSVERLLERLRVVQRDRYSSGQRDEVTALMAYAIIHLENRDDDARHAETAIEEALRDVPWIQHGGRQDPPKDFPDYVQAKFRDGETRFGIRWNWDENWWWKEGDAPHDGDIVAYRALPTATPSRESSDELAALAARYLGMSDGDFAEAYGPEVNWSLVADVKSLAGSVLSQAGGGLEDDEDEDVPITLTPEQRDWYQREKTKLMRQMLDSVVVSHTRGDK